jgi:hypothetical protein
MVRMCSLVRLTIVTTHRRSTSECMLNRGQKLAALDELFPSADRIESGKEMR